MGKKKKTFFISNFKSIYEVYGNNMENDKGQKKQTCVVLNR